MADRPTLTRRELADKLEKGLLLKVITFTDAHDKKICGQVRSITVEYMHGEFLVIFGLNGRRYEADLYYFIENTVVNGDTHRRDDRDIRWILQEN